MKKFHEDCHKRKCLMNKTINFIKWLKYTKQNVKKERKCKK